MQAAMDVVMGIVFGGALGGGHDDQGPRVVTSLHPVRARGAVQCMPPSELADWNRVLFLPRLFRIRLPFGDRAIAPSPPPARMSALGVKVAPWSSLISAPAYDPLGPAMV